MFFTLLAILRIDSGSTRGISLSRRKITHVIPGATAHEHQGPTTDCWPHVHLAADRIEISSSQFGEIAQDGTDRGLSM